MQPTDDEAVALLRPLDTEPVTPSTVDIERALREGRRRRRRQRTTRSVALVAAVGLMVAGGTAAVTRLRGLDPPDQNAVENSASASAGASAGPSAGPSVSRRPPILAGPPAAPTRCAVSTLPIPDGVKRSIVTGADPTGRIIVGRSYLGDGDKQVIMWHDGRPQKVPMVGGDPALDDVNTAGTAVGVDYGSGEGAGPSPMVFSGGTARKLATAGRTGGEAAAINEAGTIVGSLGSRGRGEEAVRWSGPNSQPEVLPMPPGFTSTHATDIDEDGTIVGWIGDQAAPYVWFADGEHRQLPVPTLDGVAAANADARSVRNGWVVGLVQYPEPSPQVRSVRWNLYTGEVTVFPEFNGADAVNAHGWQVGPARTPGGLLRTDRTTVALTGLPLSDEAHSLSVIPKTVTDDGRTIAGQSDDSSNTLRAVIWRCT